MEDTIETLYSQEEILTYISFARQFKPQLAVVSKNIKILLVNCVFVNILYLL